MSQSNVANQSPEIDPNLSIIINPDTSQSIHTFLHAFDPDTTSAVVGPQVGDTEPGIRWGNGKNYTPLFATVFAVLLTASFKSQPEGETAVTFGETIYTMEATKKQFGDNSGLTINETQLAWAAFASVRNAARSQSESTNHIAA